MNVGLGESAPESVDMDRASLTRALDLAASRRAKARLCVVRYGRIVLNRGIGCDPEALFLAFSAGKPLVTMLVHQLAERGELSLDDPIAKHWPEYARNGKAAITIRHVLQHRAGVPTARRSLLGDALAMTNWDRSVRNASEARPRWQPSPGHGPGRISSPGHRFGPTPTPDPDPDSGSGSDSDPSASPDLTHAPGYHVLTYGFILGELVRRITGVEVPEYLHQALLNPLGMHNTYLGLPPNQWHGRVPVRATRPTALPRSLAFNSHAVRTATIPAANVSTTAADLARFYQAMLNGGELDGVRVLRPETIAEARKPSNDGERDRILDRPVRWSQGFQLGGADYRSDPERHDQPMGNTSSRNAFGHNGSNVCNAWADPDRNLVFVYLTNLLAPRAVSARHQAEVSDAVLSACC